MTSIQNNIEHFLELLMENSESLEEMERLIGRIEDALETYGNSPGDS